MFVGKIFTLFVVPEFYSLIAAQHSPETTRQAIETPEPELAATRTIGEYS